MRNSSGKQSGFALLVLLLALAVMGLVAVEIVHVERSAQRHAAEVQLLRVGLAYRRAIASYVGATPAGTYNYPRQLADLLRDPRFPNVRHHLRAIYEDPITNSTRWGVIVAPGGGIAGVYSLSGEAPIKVAEFSQDLKFFEEAQTYRDWVFSVLPATQSTVRMPVDDALDLQSSSANTSAPPQRNPPGVSGF
jgi:type II secretory pathway pseudopilin PulG